MRASRKGKIPRSSASSEPGLKRINSGRINVAVRTELPESSRYIIKSGGPKSCAKLQVVTRACVSSLVGVLEERRERERER